MLIHVAEIAALLAVSYAVGLALGFAARWASRRAGIGAAPVSTIPPERIAAVTGHGAAVVPAAEAPAEPVGVGETGSAAPAGETMAPAPAPDMPAPAMTAPSEEAILEPTAVPLMTVTVDSVSAAGANNAVATAAATDVAVSQPPAPEGLTEPTSPMAQAPLPVAPDSATRSPHGPAGSDAAVSIVEIAQSAQSPAAPLPPAEPPLSSEPPPPPFVPDGWSVLAPRASARPAPSTPPTAASRDAAPSRAPGVAWSGEIRGRVAPAPDLPPAAPPAEPSAAAAPQPHEPTEAGSVAEVLSTTEKPDWTQRPAPDLGAAVAAAQTAVEAALVRSGLDPSETRDAAAFGKPSGLRSPLGRRDDLKKINGLEAVDESMLNGMGVFHYDQIAEWDDKEILWLENHVFEVGRIAREDWQAQALALVRSRAETSEDV